MQPRSVFARKKEDRFHTTAIFDQRVRSAVVRTPRGRFTPWARDEMIRQRKNGQTLLEIMTRFGASESFVRRTVGVRKIKPKAIKDVIDPAVVVSLMKQGKTWGFIGDYFGVAESTVRRKVKWRKLKPAHDLQYEEWRPVLGFEGLYEASSEGRVRSLDRVRTNLRSNGKTQTRIWRGRIIGQHNRDGFVVSLSRDGVLHQRKVHIVICEAFHGRSPEGMRYVEFIDDNPLNYSPGNLRWSKTRYRPMKLIAGRKLVLR